jgi:aspartyl-tRNA(Asn)/glutamyl-tRNA(Gln) amidotransferase subunit A
MARTAEDCALMLQALAGNDRLDPSSSTESVPDYTATLDAGIKGLRIGVPDSFFFDDVEPGVERAVGAAIEMLRDLGAEVRDVSLPLIAEAPAAVGAIMLPEALAFHQRWLNERPDDYGEDVRFRLENGATFLAVHYVQAQRFREMIVAAWRDEVFGQVDILATPTTLISAPLVEEEGGSALLGAGLRTTFSLIRNTNPLNLLGIPAISLPCGFTDGGLPIGLQLAGRWWEEAAILRAAHAFQQATDWHLRRPPLASA